MKGIAPLVVGIFICACHSHAISRDAVRRAGEHSIVRDTDESKRTDAQRTVGKRDKFKRDDVKRKDMDIDDITQDDYMSKDSHDDHDDGSDFLTDDLDRFNERRGETHRDNAGRRDVNIMDARESNKENDFDITNARRDAARRDAARRDDARRDDAKRHAQQDNARRDAARRDDAKRHAQQDNARRDASLISLDADDLSEELNDNLDALFDVQDQISRKDTLSKRGKACMFIGRIIEDGKTKIFNFHGHSITITCRNGNHIYII